jgi:aminoglycoside 2''-phosphotransferase
MLESDAVRWPSSHDEAAVWLAGVSLPGARARLRPAGAGDFCLAFRHGARIVRAARHAEAAAALHREASVMPRLAAALPLPVPVPRFANPRAGCAFAVHTRVPGTVLTRAVWERRPAARRTRLAAELGAFLSALHAAPTEPAEQYAVPRLDAAGYAARLQPSAAGVAARFPHRVTAHLHERLAARLTAWSARPAGSTPAVLLHGDVAPGHVLFDPRRDRLTGIIDFGDLAIGDPARDFIYVYEDFGPALLAEVLDAYPHGDRRAFVERIHMWFLLEALAWTEARAEAGDEAAVAEGVTAMAAELDLLETESATGITRR